MVDVPELFYRCTNSLQKLTHFKARRYANKFTILEFQNMQPCWTKKPVRRKKPVTHRYLQVLTCKTLTLLPRSTLTYGKVLIWSHRCMICGFFLAGNLCIPVDHLHSWCALSYFILILYFYY